MTGPSASGSENGTPTSSTSAPARSSARRISAERGRSGSPAVVYVTSPVVRSERRRAKRSAILPIPPFLPVLHCLHVLVAASGKIDEHDAVASQLASDRARVRDGVRRLERRQNSLEARQRFERVERLGIAYMRVLGTSERSQPGVLRPDGRVIEARRDGVRRLNVAVLILQNEGAGSLQDAGAAAG